MENQEIREKVIKIIHKRLDEIRGEDIFFNAYLESDKTPVHGYGERTLRHKTTTINSKKTYESTDEITLDFKLLFKDDEPSIKVITQVGRLDTKNTKTLIKRRFFRKNIYKKTIDETWVIVTQVIIGKYIFTLTEEERLDLVIRVKKAVDKRLKMKENFEYEKLIGKLELRLK